MNLTTVDLPEDGEVQHEVQSQAMWMSELKPENTQNGKGIRSLVSCDL